MLNLPALRSFGRDQTASAAVEYAAMLTLVLAMLLVAVDALGLAGKYSFQHVSAALSPGASHVSSSSDKAAGAAKSGLAQQAKSFLPQIASLEAVPWLHLMLAVALVLGLGANWKLTRHLRRARQAVAESQASDEQRDQARFLQKRQQILRTLGFDISRLLESRVEVRHVMTERVRTVTPLTPANIVAEQMADLQCHHLLVCEEDGRLLGVISDRDLRSRSGLVAQEVMTPRPIVATPDTLLVPAASAMLEKNISCLPVVKDDRVCGVLTRTDLIMTLQCCLQTLHQMLGRHSPNGEEEEEDYIRDSVSRIRSVTISELCRAGN